MSRPLRIEYKDAWYHVMNRGRRGENVFMVESDYVRFRDLLRESAELWNVNVCAYCLMPNHYHLLLHTPDANLSRFMRHVSSIYTQRFNRYHSMDGQLFKGRYKSILIGEEGYLLELLRYICFNPVKAGLVTSPEDYNWSSYNACFSDHNGDDWLKTDLILEKIGGRSPTFNENSFSGIIQTDASDDIYAFFNKKNLPSILGSKEFKNQIGRDFFRTVVHPEVPESKQLTPEAQTILKTVCSYFKIKENDLFLLRRGKRNLPRDIAIYLIRTRTAKTLSEIGNFFEIHKYSSVSSSVERLKRQMQNSPEVLHDVESIEKLLE